MQRRWIKDSEGPYFLTHTISGWNNVLVHSGLVGIIFDSFSYYRFQYQVKIHAYVIMPNHVHFIVSVRPEIYSLKSFVRDFKSSSAKKLYHRLQLMGEEDGVSRHKLFKRIGLPVREPLELCNYFQEEGKKLWQNFAMWLTDDKPVLLETQKMFEERLLYLHDNPVRKGWVDYPEDYPYSSAGFYINGTNFPFRVDDIFSDEG